MPSLVFMEITRKSKVDFPPIRISESDMASRTFLQTRISIELMATVGPLGSSRLLLDGN